MLIKVYKIDEPRPNGFSEDEILINSDMIAKIEVRTVGSKYAIYITDKTDHEYLFYATSSRDSIESHYYYLKKWILSPPVTDIVIDHRRATKDCLHAFIEIARSRLEQTDPYFHGRGVGENFVRDYLTDMDKAKSKILRELEEEKKDVCKRELK